MRPAQVRSALVWVRRLRLLALPVPPRSLSLRYSSTPKHNAR